MFISLITRFLIGRIISRILTPSKKDLKHLRDRKHIDNLGVIMENRQTRRRLERLQRK